MIDDRLIYTPGRAAQLTSQVVDAMSSPGSRVMRVGLPMLDAWRDEWANGIVPLLPGNLMTVMAQTSHGKTTVMRCLAHGLANQLSLQNRSEIILWFDFETAIESDVLARQQSLTGVDVRQLIKGGGSGGTDAVKKAVEQVTRYPIVTIGNSLVMEQGGYIDTLTADDIQPYASHVANEYFGEPRLIAAVFIDYLQAIPYAQSRFNEHHLAVKHVVHLCRHLGSILDCPVILGVQAKQDSQLASTLNSTIKIPGHNDGLYSSSIGQRTDVNLSLWMPKHHHSPGSIVDSKLGIGEFEVESDMVFARVTKQRVGRTGLTVIYRLEDGQLRPHERFHPGSERFTTRTVFTDQTPPDNKRLLPIGTNVSMGSLQTYSSGKITKLT